jgi:hypothetical protein
LCQRVADIVCADILCPDFYWVCRIDCVSNFGRVSVCAQIFCVSEAHSFCAQICLRAQIFMRIFLCAYFCLQSFVYPDYLFLRPAEFIAFLTVQALLRVQYFQHVCVSFFLFWTLCCVLFCFQRTLVHAGHSRQRPLQVARSAADLGYRK